MKIIIIILLLGVIPLDIKSVTIFLMFIFYSVMKDQIKHQLLPADKSADQPSQPGGDTGAVVKAACRAWEVRDRGFVSRSDS